MDTLSPERRSENMRRIKSRDTSPERMVRQMVRTLGFGGYRLHRKDIPGKPDIAWIGKRAAIFVHGCFWHGHDCPEGIRKPKSNRAYWLPKIERNRQRDGESVRALKEHGWFVLTIWECELRLPARVLARLESSLEKHVGKTRT